MGANRSAADDFDQLVRSTVSGSSRRGFLRLLLGSTISAGIATVTSPMTTRGSGSTSPIDPTTGQPYFVCEPSCGPCHICVHAFLEEPACLPQCDRCSFCNADDETCVSSCSSCQTCKAGECQSTCPDCQQCDGDTCRPCGEGPCERCEGGLCVGCQPNCETCNPVTNTCQTTCAGGQTCCAGMCAGCCGPCNHATGTCKDWQDNVCIEVDGHVRTCCPDGCWDLKDDPDHCGTCTGRCQPWEECCDGVCADVRAGDDPYNCGACGRACDEGFVCCRGVCTSQEVADADGLDCCPKERLCAETCCPKGQRCKNGVCECPGSQQACVDDQGNELCCGQGERCCNGQCIPFNDGCCPPGEHVARECGGCCPDGQVCQDGTCQALQCEYPESSCYDENGDYTVCCGQDQSCDFDTGTCQADCHGWGPCGPGEVCCDTPKRCVTEGYCCPPGSSPNGVPCGPKCCPDDTYSCGCECIPFDQLCR